MNTPLPFVIAMLRHCIINYVCMSEPAPAVLFNHAMRYGGSKHLPYGVRQYYTIRFCVTRAYPSAFEAAKILPQRTVKRELAVIIRGVFP